MAAHRTARSSAIGSSFLGSKNATISKSEKIAPPIASTLHQPNGTQNHTSPRFAEAANGVGKPAFWVRPVTGRCVIIEW